MCNELSLLFKTQFRRQSSRQNFSKVIKGSTGGTEQDDTPGTCCEIYVLKTFLVKRRNQPGTNQR